MPLQSKHFKGDPRLEACLVDDSAHVVRNARGHHVTKIQAALYTLQGHVIDPKEQQQEWFGITTSKAVYAYRKHHDIRRGNQPITDIVGKKTIAMLDFEMALYEGGNPRKPSTSPGVPSARVPPGKPGKGKSEDPKTPTTPGTPTAKVPSAKPGTGMCGPLREVASGVLNLRQPIAHVYFNGGMDAIFEFSNNLSLDALISITLAGSGTGVVGVPGSGTARSTHLRVKATPVEWNFFLRAAAKTASYSLPGTPEVTIPSPIPGKPDIAKLPSWTPPPIPLPTPWSVRWRALTDWRPGDDPCAFP